MRELSGYFVSSIEHWKKNLKLEVWVVYWPTNQDAPFLWNLDSEVHFIIKSDFFKDVANDDFWQSTRHLFVAGWSDSAYNRIVKKQRSFPKTILFDTQWESSLRMQLGRFWLYFKSIRYFQSAWVPGNRQGNLAKKLFFKPHQIYRHFYVGDQFLFDNPNVSFEKDDRPLNIIYVGRLIPEKGVLPFIQCFIDASMRDSKLNWHLHVCGIGSLFNACPKHEHVTYHGFVQPRELAHLFQSMDVFVLPSIYEPWGVVVHEAAFAGLVLMVSQAVGSADDFVEHGNNGFIFPTNDTTAILRRINEYQALSQKEKHAMALHSQVLARRVNLDVWANVADQIIHHGVCVE